MLPDKCSIKEGTKDCVNPPEFVITVVSDNDQLKEKNDILVLADDWLLNEDLQMDVSSLGNLHDWSHAGRYGNRSLS